MREPGVRVSDDGVAHRLLGTPDLDHPRRGRIGVPIPDSLAGLRWRRLDQEPDDGLPRARRLGVLHRLLSSTLTVGPWMFADGHVTTPHLDKLVAHTAESRDEGPEAYPALARLWSAYLERFDPVLRTRTELTFDYALEDARARLAEIAGEA